MSATPRHTPTRAGASRSVSRVAEISEAPRPRWAPAFLATFRKLGNVSAAAAAAGVDRRTVYRLRDRSPGFADDWRDALEEAGEILELEAHRRAVDGVEEPIVSGGKVAATVRRYSDQLLMFLLRGAKPGRYTDRHEVRSSLTMAAVQGKIDRMVAAVLKTVKDPELLDRLQAEFEQIDGQRPGSP